MKKTLIVLTFALASSVTFATECDSTQCLSNHVKILKKDLNAVYKKVYSQTSAKKELDKSQKAWLNYKEIQCGDFIEADTQRSPGSIDADLSCQIDLLNQRIALLKSYITN